MTPAEQQQRELERLCLAVIEEKDPAKLTPLVEKLNKFLAEKERKPAKSDRMSVTLPVETKKEREC